jgi:hypothetical protein
MGSTVAGTNGGPRLITRGQVPGSSHCGRLPGLCFGTAWSPEDTHAETAASCLTTSGGNELDSLRSRALLLGAFLMYSTHEAIISK